MHYDDDGRIQYTLIGAAGAEVVDSFTRADQVGLGSVPGGAAWSSRGGPMSNIVGNAADAGGQNYVPVAAGDTTMTCRVLSSTSGSWGVTIYARLDAGTGLCHGGSLGWNSGGTYDWSIVRGGTPLATGATTLPVVFNREYEVTLATAGPDIVLVIRDTVTGASETHITTDPGSDLIGSNCGFTVSGGGSATSRVLDFQASNNGTLEWAPSGMVVVEHGADDTVARPEGAVAVYWIGTVEPLNWTDEDLWNGP